MDQILPSVAVSLDSLQSIPFQAADQVEFAWPGDQPAISRPDNPR